jgi:hypothetical protein
MKHSKKTIQVTALAAMFGIASTILPVKKADAAVGVLIALASNDSASQGFGWVLAGIGGLTAIIGTQSSESMTSCSPSSPCACTTSNTADQSCVVSGGPSTSSCLGDENVASCSYTYNGLRTRGTQGTAVASSSTITIGLVLLGTDAMPNAQFKALDSKSARDLKISNDQMVEFNHALPQINLIANSFLSQLKQEVVTGVKADQLQRDSAALWASQAKPVLKPDAYTALQIASAAYLKAMRGQMVN